MRWRALLVLALAMLVVAGCGSGGQAGPATTGSTSPSSTTSGAAALQAEASAAAAGDIPDNQVFLVFQNARAGYSMKYPEGWAQQGSAGTVSFRDKNNVVRAVVSAGHPWTLASVRADVRGLKGARVRGGVQALKLSGRPAFRVVYRTVSPVNPVTGKRVTLSVDRYYLFAKGQRAVLDLGCPVGVDNVDAYRLISESFRWR